MRVFRRTVYGDWDAACTCGDVMGTEDWFSAMEWTVGHLCFTHQRDIDTEEG